MPFAVLPLLLFALTLFVSATLLFLVQPMVGKVLLPMLGGTPAVWNTCMVFFQALLLAGYAYAHAATAWLGARRQAVLHLGVLLLPFLTLGLTIDRDFVQYGEGSPIPGLLLGLLVSVGLPFFVVSTSAPLLQKWFADTGHPAAKDPYFLYGASNLGSMLALLGYPTVVEPYLRLADQRLAWQIGYGLLVLLTALCAVTLWRSGRSAKEAAARAEEAPADDAPAPTWRRRMRWVLLAFVPSSLMLGATTYMTTDIAAIPLLWVLPLALYLLSFILVFSRLPRLVHRIMVVLLPILVLVLVFLILSSYPLAIWVKVPAHLVVLFVAAMVCHGELARDRPSPRYLTEFYLWMSVGGVLGGLFNALLAPMIFSGIVEYPLVLVLACLLTPPEEGETSRLGPVLGAGLVGLFLGLGLAFLVPALGRSDLELSSLASAEGLWLLVAVVGAAALVFLPNAADDNERSVRWLDLALPLALGVLFIGLNLGLRIRIVHNGLDRLFGRLHASLPEQTPERISKLLDLDSSDVLVLFIFVVPAVLCYLFVKRPVRFGLGVGALLLASAFCHLLDEDIKLRDRSFFGALRVSEDGVYRKLEHGTTLHGWQRVRWGNQGVAVGATQILATADPLGVATRAACGLDVWSNPGREPQTYFHPTGPIGQVFTAYREFLANRHVGIIGLGSGTMAAYGQPGQRITYYEIDPLVKRIANNPDYFTYLKDAEERGVVLDTVMGDARLKLEERTHQKDAEKFALLVVDAFSSDAIPIHLLTREAVEIYLANLADDGLLAFHISNRYLDLEPVLANVAEARGLTGFIQHDEERDIPGKAASTWVVLARHPGDLDRLSHEGRWAAYREAVRAAALVPGGVTEQAQTALYLGLLDNLQAPWRRLKARPEVGVWSDDYSNLLRVFDW